MDKAAMRAAHPDIAALVDEIRASGGGVAGLRIGDEEWGAVQQDDSRVVEIELGQRHEDLLRRDGHLLDTKAVRAKVAKKRVVTG